MRSSSWWMLAALAACSGSSLPDYEPRDPCAALAVTAVNPTAFESDGVRDGQALWRDRGVVAFDLATLGATDAAIPEIEVQFADAASTFHGIYDPDSERVLINRDITDRATLAIVIAHELGHVFGLPHVEASTRRSLMNPGNLLTPPTDEDQRSLEALWGACGSVVSLRP